MILAIDTSSVSGSIALVEGGRLVSERTVGDAGPHAKWLLGNIADLCQKSDIGLDKIDVFAVSVGPGSFTGLRIGLTTVKGLAWSVNKPVAGVSTLKALALNAPFAGMPVCTILDARKSEVYSALFSFSGGSCETLLRPAAITPQNLLQRLEELVPAPTPVLFLGSGLAVYREFIEGSRVGVVVAREPLWHVRASNIAFLAQNKDCEAVSAINLTPFYLRKSEAELRLKQSVRASLPTKAC